MSKSVAEKFDALSTTTKIIIVVVVLITVFIIYKRVQHELSAARVQKFNNRGNDEEVRDIRPMVDQIYHRLNGINFTSYPEDVNKIVNLTDTELEMSVNYWDDEYRNTTGHTFYGFIANESTLQYIPALEKLERKGFRE